MFGAGWTEMLIIGIVALVVIGPKDLPVVMRKLGRVVRTVQRMGQEFQSELTKTTGLDQITDLKRSITEPLRQSSDEIMREFNRQTATGVEPTGIMKPTDPKVESVYDQIAATSGLTQPSAATSASTEVSASTEPAGSTDALPGPAEASPVVAKPRRTRKPAKVATATKSAPEPISLAPAETAVPVIAEPAEPKAKPRAAARPRKAAAKASTVAPVVSPVVPAAPKRSSRAAAASAPEARRTAKKA